MSLSKRSKRALCLLGYLVFMGLALDSRIVDALVYCLTDAEGGNSFVASGKIDAAPIAGAQADAQGPVVVALRFRDREQNQEGARQLDFSIEPLPASDSDAVSREVEFANNISIDAPSNADSDQRRKNLVQSAKSSLTFDNHSDHMANQVAVLAQNAQNAQNAEITEILNVAETVPQTPVMPENGQSREDDANDTVPSVLAMVKSIANLPWRLDPKLNRYVVRYNRDTTIVLSIRPALQRILEDVLAKRTSKIASGIIQDPYSGAILAMTSKTRGTLRKVTDKDFLKNNWNTKATFPVASIFKIVTAAAGLDTKKITANSQIKAWKKHSMPVWEAFARSHNGVFGNIAQRVGHATMVKYATAFGFNKPFFFDLPVDQSKAKLPKNSDAMGKAAAGLQKDFLVSPMHVASIVSTVLNRGQTMKPYLVDYVIHKDQVIFRRKPFPLAKPMQVSSAKSIHRMMQATTTQGTGKVGFSPKQDCCELPHLSGGKTGTLTGEKPNFLITWFGGFTKTAGRELCIVTMCGQSGSNNTRGATLAGDLSYQLYRARRPPTRPPASAAAVAKK